jgi:hypothetical protein
MTKAMIAICFAFSISNPYVFESAPLGEIKGEISGFELIDSRLIPLDQTEDEVAEEIKNQKWLRLKLRNGNRATFRVVLPSKNDAEANDSHLVYWGVNPTATPTPTPIKPPSELLIGKYLDANRDGKYNYGEKTASARFIVDGPYSADFEIRTDSLGNAKIPTIPGQYIVCEDQEPGWDITTPGMEDRPWCQLVVLNRGDSKGALFGNAPKVPKVPEAPMPPATGLARGDSFEVKAPLILKEIAPKDRIVSVEIIRGDKVIAGGRVDVAPFGPSRVMAKGVMHEINTWNVSLQGGLSQLDGGGLNAEDPQDHLAGHNRVDTGVNPIGEVLNVTEIMTAKPGDKLRKTMGDERVITQPIKFVGKGDPREFYNPQKDSTIFITCDEESDVDNAKRLVVYAEADKTVNQNMNVNFSQILNPIEARRISEEREIGNLMAQFAALQRENEQAQNAEYSLEEDELNYYKLYGLIFGFLASVTVGSALSYEAVRFLTTKRKRRIGN